MSQEQQTGKLIFETQRLRLKEFTFDDAAFIIELLNSPGWLKFIGKREMNTIEQAQDYLSNGPLKSYSENGFGLNLVERKEDNAKIGMCGIIKRNHLDNPDIGFAFLPEFMGQGYAFEIVAETMVYAKNQLNISSISAITVAENSKSIRLLEKIGLRFIKSIVSPNNEELLLYSNRD